MEMFENAIVELADVANCPPTQIKQLIYHGWLELGGLNTNGKSMWRAGWRLRAAEDLLGKDELIKLLSKFEKEKNRHV